MILASLSSSDRKLRTITTCFSVVKNTNRCYSPTASCKRNYKYKHRCKLRNGLGSRNLLNGNKITFCDEACSINIVKWHPLLDGQITRCFSQESKKRSHYDVLEITPKATQAQVKQSYYKLSKAYHPDHYKGQDAGKKFREVKEAYEVLGNLQKRRMYDKGILNFGVAATPKEAEDYSSKFYESRSKRGQMPTATGRTPIYNFDEWSKTHYEASFDRRQSGKLRYEEIKRTEQEIIEEKKAHSIMYIVLIIALAILYQSVNFKSDDPKIPSK